MPSSITQYNVFIASPGGLEAEREAFRSSLEKYNRQDGNARQVQYSPVGWETTLRGVGRPQELINRDVEQSDYLVLLLWDRWGTRPSGGGPFTLGIFFVNIKNFNRACEHYKSAISYFERREKSATLAELYRKLASALSKVKRAEESARANNQAEQIEKYLNDSAAIKSMRNQRNTQAKRQR